MKPTISNAFNDESADSADNGNTNAPAGGWATRASADPNATTGGASKRSVRRNSPRKSLAASLAAMQVDLREASFGWSLDLSPMQAIDALQAMRLISANGSSINYLVSLEQSAWRDGEHEMPISEIAQKLAIPVISQYSVDQLVMSEESLLQLVSLCQPSRLVVVAIEGVIDERDAEAVNKAVDAGHSPLLAELRALAALEVLGDRSVVLHARDRHLALAMVGENFRHYLAALNCEHAARFEAPNIWQIERLLSLTGMLTIRPIETQRFSTSIDVGINTSKERFSQPADRSLIYDIPSNTWHDEP